MESCFAAVLREHLLNPVDFDSLVTAITHQERVRVVAELSGTWNDKQQHYEYSDSTYHFILKHERGKDAFFDSRATFIDGDHSLRFSDYKPICGTDPGFRCEDYAFDLDNTLRSPKIIEVCNRRFLYSEMMFWCNGIGCSNVLVFIYDLQSHRPVFLETFQIEYDGFLLSDFDGNSSPDLLVISQTNDKQMTGFDVDELHVRLQPFDHNSGKPKVMRDKHYGRPFAFELYTVLGSASHERHSGRRYSMLKNEWIRP